MSNTITVQLQKRQKEKLHRMAVWYGLSMRDFFSHIIESLTMEMPQESFDDYERPQALRTSFKRGLADYRAGRVSARL